MGDLLGGISFAWWKRSHNVHHIVTNSVEHDPDVQHLPLMAVAHTIFARFWSSYHGKWMTMDAPARAIVRWQHVLYYPWMAVARFNLYLQSFKLLLSAEVVHLRGAELLLLAGFWAWYATLVASLPGGPAERVAYVAISHAVTGLLHVQITLSHFSMETYHGVRGHGGAGSGSDNWFRLQCATSLDVDAAHGTGWLHGGLQYQVEHHLFPRLPRHALGAVRPRVRALAAAHGVPYTITSFAEANGRVLAALRAAAAAMREIGPHGEYKDVPNLVWEGMNARG